jgi:predicted porin
MNKKLLASAIASALVIGVGAEAADFKASGQVNRVIVLPDDSAGDELQFLDNNLSGSRFRFMGNQDIGNGMKAGFRLEAQLQSNKSNAANGGTSTDVTNGNLSDNDADVASSSSSEDNIDLRYQDIYLSGSFGKVSLGKGDGAGNGRTESDLSGTDVIAPNYSVDLYSDFLFDANTKVGDLYGETDSYSRVNRLRYDSNNFNGFSFAVSYGQQEVSEIGLKFAGGDDIKYHVQGFFGSQGDASTATPAATTTTDNSDERMGVSASVLLGNGLNFTLSYSEKDVDNAASADKENLWGKVGYKMGKHAVSVDYGETENKGTTTREAETVGVSYVFAPAKGVELYAGYREYSTDDVTGGVDPEFYTVGSRVKF